MTWKLQNVPAMMAISQGLFEPRSGIRPTSMLGWSSHHHFRVPISELQYSLALSSTSANGGPGSKRLSVSASSLNTVKTVRNPGAKLCPPITQAHSRNTHVAQVVQKATNAPPGCKLSSCTAGRCVLPQSSRLRNAVQLAGRQRGSIHLRRGINLSNLRHTKNP